MKKFWRVNVFAFCICCLVAGLSIAQAADKKEVGFASVSWTGVTIKTELAVKVLEVLGYEASNTVLPVPIVYQSLSTGDRDVFLGNWMPSMATIANKFFDKGTVVKTVANMPGAKYTLAAPTYVVEGGLKDFADIAKYGDELDHEIYGIEPGNDGNEVIHTMIDNDMFGLGDFTLVETSEPMMLSQVMAYATEEKWIVFLGWAPHYMNAKIDMQYLTGSTAETFGVDNGTATVYTNVREGFAEDMPNVAHFVDNLIFSVDMMNEIMEAMEDDTTLKHLDAGLAWLKENPEVYSKWLDGVKTADGKEALPVFESYMQSI